MSAMLVRSNAALSCILSATQRARARCVVARDVAATSACMRRRLHTGCKGAASLCAVTCTRSGESRQGPHLPLTHGIAPPHFLVAPAASSVRFLSNTAGVFDVSKNAPPSSAQKATPASSITSVSASSTNEALVVDSDGSICLLDDLYIDVSGGENEEAAAKVRSTAAEYHFDATVGGTSANDAQITGDVYFAAEPDSADDLAQYKDSFSLSASSPSPPPPPTVPIQEVHSIEGLDFVPEPEIAPADFTPVADPPFFVSSPMINSLAATEQCPIVARAWPYNVVGHHPEDAYIGDPNKYVGLCFSSGGMRSASLTAGQLRALHSQGYMKYVKYISAVSGGSWASVPYTFLPTTFSDEDFLGDPKLPGELTVEDFEPPASFLHAVGTLDIPVNPLTLTSWIVEGDESYSNFLGKWLLWPFGLWDPDLTREKYFTLNKGTLRLILDRNDGKLSRDDFIIPREGRPFLIVGASLLTDSSLLPESEIPIEFTPLYSGMRVSTANAKVGGGFVESFAYDTEFGRSESDPPTIHSYSHPGKSRFTIADIIGASGAAPSQKFYATEWLLRTLSRIFPAFHHFPVGTVPLQKETQFKELVEYVHADGGVQENLGIMPLLARRTPRIVVFENTKMALDSAAVAADKITHSTIDISIAALFIGIPDNEYDGVGVGGSDYRGNVIFSSGCIYDERGVPGPELTGRALYEALVRRLNDRRLAGKPVNARGEYTVAYGSDAAKKYGIYPEFDPDTWEPRPYRVEIAWVYNELCDEWIEQLPPHLRRDDDYFHRDLDGDFAFTHRQFERFPHYETFREDGGFSVCGLRTHQAAALAHHAFYASSSCMDIDAIFRPR